MNPLTAFFPLSTNLEKGNKISRKKTSKITTKRTSRQYKPPTIGYLKLNRSDYSCT